LLAICEHYEIPLIEDAAESLGATYKAKASGTFGKLGVYSFNGNKIITTSGGGMLVSDDQALLEQARFLATQARDPALHYEHSRIGYNYRLSNILAGIGRAQLQVLDARVEARRKVFTRYFEQLSGFEGIEFAPEAPYNHSTRWLTAFTVDCDKAGVTALQIIEALAERNIEARPVWKPMHLQPLFKTSSYYPHKEQESVSDRLFRTGICVPSGSSLTEVDQDRVIAAVQAALLHTSS
jgi:pyridoxal phosphate-dependent aminotransferase EpsN